MPPDPRQPISAERSPWLRGTLRVPGDAIVTHLAVLAGAIARGETVIAGGLQSAATAAVEQAVSALGAACERTESGRLRVHGLGVGGLLAPTDTLDFGGSSLGVTLVMGLVGGYDFSVRFTADPEVSSHPRAALLDGLRAFGCRIETTDRGRLPVTLRGPELVVPADLALPPAAPATKAALILTALNSRAPSSLVEPAPSWNHAERLLRRFGARIGATALDDGGCRIDVEGGAELRAQLVDVPADPSLAWDPLESTCRHASLSIL